MRRSLLAAALVGLLLAGGLYFASRGGRSAQGSGTGEGPVAVHVPPEDDADFPVHAIQERGVPADFSAADAFVESLEEHDIAFNVPEEMRVGEPLRVVLVIHPGPGPYTRITVRRDRNDDHTRR